MNQSRTITKENTICSFSFLRSGSSWFADLLHTIPNSCLFDEPLFAGSIENPNNLPDYKLAKVRQIAELGFYYYQPIPPSANSELTSFFSSLLKGEIGSYHLLVRNKFSSLKNADTFIFQFNHANLLSHWLITHFELSAIFLLRNPYATIASILRYSAANKLTIPTYPLIVPDFKYNDIFLQYQNIYRLITTPEEYFCFLWCLNMTEGPLKSERTNCVFIFYEDLLLNFEKEIGKIFQHFNKPIPMGLSNKKSIPSISTLEYALENIKNDTQLHAWKKFLSADQINRIQNILVQFDIDFYDTSTVPKHTLFYRKMKAE